jgi:hypothetical protein
MQTLFTGTVAKVASLIAIVVGGYQFAHGEPGAKKTSARTTGGSTRRLLSGILRQRQQTETHSAACPQSQGMDRAQYPARTRFCSILQGRRTACAGGRFLHGLLQAHRPQCPTF